MEKRFQDIEEATAALKQEVSRLQSDWLDYGIDRSQTDLKISQLAVKIDTLDVVAKRTAKQLDGVFRLAVQTSDNQEFLVKKLAELTDQVNRLEEELGLVKRSVFEHTILLKNLRRDVEDLKMDMAQLKSSVGGLNEKVDRLEQGQNQILEAIRNLKN